MEPRRSLSILNRCVARALVGALIGSSPGLQPYQALAQTVAGSASGAAAPVAAPVAPVAPVGAGSSVAPLAPSAGAVLAPVAGLLPPVASVVTAAPAAEHAKLAVAQAKASPARAWAAQAGALSALGTVAAAVAGAAKALVPTATSREAQRTTGGVLAQAVRPVAAQDAAGAEVSVETLARPFEGTAEHRGDADAVVGFEGAQRPSGLQAGLARAIDLMAAAVPEPSAAPAEGAKVAPVAPRLSFGYRMRKRAAAALAAFGLTIGAPRLTAPDYEALVGRFREAPPKLVIMDYDDTFMDNHDGKDPGVTPEKLAVIERLNASGIRVAFATNRPLDGGSWAMSAMLMERMPESMRRNFILSTGGGAEVYQYGPNGEKPQSAARSNPLTEAEFADLKRMLHQKAAKLGLTEFREDAKSYEYTAVFQPRESRLKELFPAFEKAVRKAGYDFSVTLKTFDGDPKKQDLEPYIRVSKSSKAMAIRGILELIAAEGAKIQPEDVVMIGDDFTVPGYDSAMARALPQGTALAVGAGADARLANTYLLPKVGPEQTVDFLDKIVKK